MKKTIQKPENWQDFETLCKKLWGEIWKIPNEIKKNGRSGQTQCGVDVYGIPKGEEMYWGIQCKGKDDYSKNKLTKKEVDLELEKAKKFKPELGGFIFASTMNKDVDIEGYIRNKDVESRKGGGFKIYIYCWEDIADLIDENQDTYNFYVAGQQHKTKFDFEIYLNDYGSSEYIIRPKCIRAIKRYKLEEPITNSFEKIFNSTSSATSILNSNLLNVLNNVNLPQYKSYRKDFLPERWINEGICSFKIKMSNIGSVFIEDMTVFLEVMGEYSNLMNSLGSGPFGMVNLVEAASSDVRDNKVKYSPRKNEPLAQKTYFEFNLYIIPLAKKYQIPIKWELIARGFDKTGIIYLNVEPEYEDKIIYEYVKFQEEILEDEIVSVEIKKYKAN